MNSNHLENELLRYTKGLSNETLQEIIDFVQFLRQKQKKAATNLTQELSKMSVEQTSHLEKEFEDYKKKYPSE